MERGRMASERSRSPAAQVAPGRAADWPLVDGSPRGMALAQTKAMIQHSARGRAPQVPASQSPVQRIMDKAKLTKTEYTGKLRSQVILYAELNGKPVGGTGVFTSGGSNHAEDNLIAALGKNPQGALVVWLSASPCSSIFGTRKHEGEGCQEKLEKLNQVDGLSIEVRADHLYQPQDLKGAESENGYATGFSSASSAATSAFPLHLGHASKAVQESISGLSIKNENVAQLRPR